MYENEIKKQKTVDAYISAVAAISDVLDALKAFAVDDHLGVCIDDVNWGNVGMAQHLLALLNEAAKYAGV